MGKEGVEGTYKREKRGKPKIVSGIGPLTFMTDLLAKNGSTYSCCQRMGEGDAKEWG